MKVSGIGLINACKVATIASIAAYAYMFGFRTLRAWIYVALHGSYLIWWFIHQRLSPTWGPTVFPVGDIPALGVLLVFLAVGPGYSLPGYYAFKSQDEPQPWLVTACIMAFAWGSLINAAADFYKDGAKSAKSGGGLVTSGPFRLCRHPNWFGDWLRYGSFVAISGAPSPFAFFPLAWTLLFNLGSLKERNEGQLKRSGGEKYIAATPAVIPWRLLF